ncbi:MAG: hypothetical protein HC801_02075 [Nitrospira sp.]|nr:hypothetical protein [Nitrospira sp.]
MQTPPLRYYHFPPANGSFSSQELKADEAYLVPNFDFAEELVASGVDSARIAISDCSSPDGPPRDIPMLHWEDHWFLPHRSTSTNR